MFERFTDSARRAIAHAQEESRALGHDRIGAEHLLLGLLHEDTGPAGAVLGSSGLTLADARSAVVAAGGASEHPPPEHIRFGARAKHVLERSVREAQLLSHTFAGSGHLLLGLLDENEGVTADILTRCGVGSEAGRRQILAAIAATQEAAPPEPLRQPGADIAIARANARAREIAVQLGQVRAEKDAAIDGGDFAAVTAAREREKALLAQRAQLIIDLQPGGQAPPDIHKYGYDKCAYESWEAVAKWSRWDDR
ncbi:Clp protease N-terminal domain-containing protein [Candidatus Frankia alpina]|uniref:Clp protease N-terminal domain-containing protein n=1 Tax=Candidatus Frankia alpina TaxID=2699483 RepID=UPI0013D59C02|nr:Clp protease N-terminal domain-containing protein [Candidatus Frankia alpina]